MSAKSFQFFVFIWFCVQTLRTCLMHVHCFFAISVILLIGCDARPKENAFLPSVLTAAPLLLHRFTSFRLENYNFHGASKHRDASAGLARHRNCKIDYVLKKHMYFKDFKVQVWRYIIIFVRCKCMFRPCPYGFLSLGLTRGHTFTQAAVA